MYADRHARSSLDPRSLGIAVLLNGAAVAVLLLAQPALRIVVPEPPLHTYAVPLPVRELPPPPRQTEPRPPLHQTIAAPRPQVDVTVPVQQVAVGEATVPQPLPSAETGPGLTIVPEATPTPALVTTAPEIDPAHRGDLQPAYPAAELRAEREGVVVVRVLVGVDGRVRQVDQVSATSDAFFRATREQALRHWRFRPATRGQVPVEASRTMTIRFVIPR